MRRELGFTLIEVLVALMILAGAIVLASSAWSGNLVRLEKTRVNTTMALLLQRKMTEIELEYRDKALAEFPDEDNGEFEGYPQFRWQLESKEFVMPDISSALIARDEGADQNLLSLIGQMTTMISQNIREVTVTVIYTSKRSKQEIKNSVTTYFVDYQSDLGLGGIGGGQPPAGPTSNPGQTSGQPAGPSSGGP